MLRLLPSLIGTCLTIGLLLSSDGLGCSRSSNAAETDLKPEAASRLDAEPFQEMIRGILLKEVKDKYEDKRHWGQTKQIEQVQVRGKWFEPRIEKQTVEVNDGLWQRIEVKLIEPDKNLQARVLPSDSKDPNRSAFALELAAKLSGEARIERWRSGVKFFNTSVQFEARVTGRIDCDLGIRFVPGKWIDDVVVDPKITAVDLRMPEFQLLKVGVIGRDLARELSDPLRPLIEHEIKRREGRIVEKANAAIEKRRDQLRFSADKLVVSGWSKLQSAISGPVDEKAKP
jgi:hypothetical protein